MRRCALDGVQAVEAHSRHAFPRHTHDSYGIGIITSGAQRSWSGRGVVEAERGDVITCNPGEVHDGVPLSETRTWRMLYIAPLLVARIVSDIREGGSSDFEFIDPVIKLRAGLLAFGETYDALTGQRRDGERAHELLILLLAKLLREKSHASIPVAHGLTRAKSRIDDDPTMSITIAELAREAGVSRFQLVRGFAKMTGLTPHAYLVQRRLEGARAKISVGYSLASIAVSCGFADQPHFTRNFVARYGITPGIYAQGVR